MRSQFSKRLRSASLSAIPPPQSSTEYSPRFADIAAHILYRSPLPSQADLPVFILNAAAFPDVRVIDYSVLLPYVLARLPDEDELIGGKGYEVVFFAGGEDGGATATMKGRPGWSWLLQAYHLLTRATRKRMQKLYLVHERKWIRVMVEMFSTIVSPKSRKKIVHVSCMSALALYIPIEDLLIPPSAYRYDRRVSPEIHVPYASGKRAFGAKHPLPISTTASARLPRVLRESTSFLMLDQNIKKEGIFRINARAVEVDVLKKAYDRGQKFIIWKEGECVLTYSHWKQGYGNVMVEEVEQAEGYGARCAASLIKQWYGELRDPIFPKSCYNQLEVLFGDAQDTIETSRLSKLISVDSEWSLISQTSRLILTMHLLPLLSRVAEHQDWNQMSPYNLAVCITPTLLCGPDPIEDAKIGDLVRRVLEALVVNWKSELSAQCGLEDWSFEESLRLPEIIEDREDPLEDVPATSPIRDTQIEGITLIDNDDSDWEDDEDARPALPPRPIASQVSADLGDSASNVRRKPAPTVYAPPRYSLAVAESPLNLLQLPSYQGTINDSSTRERDSLGPAVDLNPAQVAHAVPRKPVPSKAAAP